MNIEEINRLDAIADKVVTKYSGKSARKREMFEIIVLQDILNEMKEIKALLIKPVEIKEETISELKKEEIKDKTPIKKPISKVTK